ncbi:hypothetical protein [Senegalia massiliensis]|uniref:hypothetical protein n=1 Tax=Senegalia massiliensis TaxID=1720316 RepID=UPI001030AA84|nr:hypothetical protein [Senegalia massiliensis]
MLDKETKKREYLHLYNFISEKGDSISFRINPDENITKDRFEKYESADSLNDQELDRYLILELEKTVYINHDNKSENFEERDATKLERKDKVELLKKVAKIRECDVK